MPNSYQQYTDEQLAAALGRRQDRAAMAELYERFGARMFHYFYRSFYRDQAKAEDFTQELFLKILEKSRHYKPEYPFKTWIYTLAANLCKNEFRRLAVREKAQPLLYHETTEQLPETIDQAILDAALRLALDALDPMHRQCVLLRYQEALSIKEIASILDCPEGTVKSRIFNALRKLGEHIPKNSFI